VDCAAGEAGGYACTQRLTDQGRTGLGRREHGVERVLIEPEKLAGRVAELAAQIDEWYPAEPPVLIGVLNGAVVFMTELMQAMSIPVSVDFMAVSSYGTSTKSSGVVQILKDLSESIEGKDVLVVEDIVDYGF
jgi:hypoxanthine phosphoribosyltransferase